VEFSRPAPPFAFNWCVKALWRVKEHNVQIFGRIALIAVAIILIALLMLVVIWPYLEGVFLPTRLACDSETVHCYDRVQITPGESFSKSLSFTNRYSYPRDYRVAFIQFGSLWSCDGRGQDLYYETSWSSGADLHLEPGETESVDLSFIFPQLLNNECQGKAGRLGVRYYFRDQEGETCECRLSPMASLLGRAVFGAGNLVGCSCAEVEWSWFDFNYP
jgi:hypothetical protein